MTEERVILKEVKGLYTMKVIKEFIGMPIGTQFGEIFDINDIIKEEVRNDRYRKKYIQAT